MKLTEKNITLKDGTSCVLRSPGPEDAKAMLDLLKDASLETYFLLRYPEEWTMTEEQERKWLQDTLDSKNEVMINAVIDGELAGNAGISCIGDLTKMRHRASFAVAVREKFWHRGLGSVLTEEVLRAAKDLGYEQVELGVFEDNLRAEALYKKFGFEEWGRMKNAFKLKDGTYRDEIQMGKLLKKV